MGGKPLHFRFHDPNPAEVTADFLLQLLVESHQPAMEQAIARAANIERSDEQEGFSLDLG